VSRDLARGPARLCLALGIDRALDGADACVPSSPLRVGTGAEPAARSEKIATGPRVGVSSAAEIPWRFWLEGDPTVSAYRAAVPRRPKLVTP
jgi:DNA-3-methyladenine glycosylase